MAMTKDISEILKNWPTESELAARRIVGKDGTEQIQLRIDLGILQMELDGRPDGERPFGQPSLLDHLLRVSGGKPDLELDAETWNELDREIYQFYHRRRALLILGAHSHAEGENSEAIRHYRRAVRDANHNLRIMDFIKGHSPNDEFVEGHERYRPFVLMHRTLAEAQTELINKDADQAIERLKEGIAAIEETYEEAEGAEMVQQDPSILQLRALERQIRRQHSLDKTLQEQLDEAVRNEEYERAAELRDRMRARQETRMHGSA
ncbi:MAG: UvrB/UvrC motif-containing protein [Phycisphaerae bacterium]|nr:UvrB/UvrC motif-containing protein [Phycisphaerae bacterium]